MIRWLGLHWLYHHLPASLRPRHLPLLVSRAFVEELWVEAGLRGAVAASVFWLAVFLFFHLTRKARTP